jgi:hypothetical protein
MVGFRFVQNLSLNGDSLMPPPPSSPDQLAAVFHALALLAIIVSGFLLMVPMGGSRKLAARFFSVGIIMAVGAAMAPGFLA